ncbi:tetrapyrrole methylase family protein/MazG family protein [Anoxybacillus mongoliensis]|uniref:Tetrapyrrole methylase family protein/MazG family protein n=1 Tax=Anoxybacillus mongoliensis TaxID=452565 RepID=A0A7W8JJ17_9BACL|nr:nucleoside triphosphate pyrophosphohydrolase [Anoxybacillus mongoliensis]MBB5356598.1 tetrapyrrole methylase family protein/MazG family protein [Anoxybacillus mongoliensis]MCX8001758.1 nucleoside triphosphate pyrophosphohydrolase [Anoxybacillus mongoliensis]
MGTITIVGLGAGDIDQLSFGVYRTLKQANRIFLRTKDHPVVAQLEAEGIHVQSFDEIYEKYDQFEQVYEHIVEHLCEEVKKGDVIYAVPGHPLVAERTVKLLLEKKDHISVRVEGGQSFLDALFTAVELDPIEGFQFVDATSFQSDEIQLRNHIIFCQVYDSFIASDVKLALLEKLPHDYPVFIIYAAGSKQQRIEKVPLYELDRVVTVSNLTSVYVPKVENDDLLYHDFTTLRRIIATLRGPNGCPWDRKQTHQSLKKYLLEETYELLDAIDRQDDENMIEELGDVLLQVMLHAQIGEDEGMFSIDDVIRVITEKMIRRHPHVFGDVHVEHAEHVVRNWEAIKQAEKEHVPHSLLDDVAQALPGTLRAYEYQKRAAKVGFDWSEVEPMWRKVEEEMNEVKQEANHMDEQKLKAEFGDLLFALINVCRYYKVNPEEALAMANEKFYRRFQYIEKKVKQLGKEWHTYSLDQLDEIWEEAKREGL